MTVTRRPTIPPRHVMPHLDSAKAGPRIPTSAQTYADALAASFDRMRNAYAFPQRYLFGAEQSTAKPKRGDKVVVSITAYVSEVADGVVTLTDQRRAFPADETIVGGGTVGDGVTLTVLEAAPAEPRVGDQISGATVRATPWRRGTTLADDMTGDTYVLTSSGKWVNIDATEGSPGWFEFDDFGDAERFTVEFAPGKASA